MADNLHDSAADTSSPAPGILISGHFDELCGYRVQRSNGTRDWLITFTLSGQGVYKLGSISQTCKCGDLVLLTPGTPHHYATKEKEQGTREDQEMHQGRDLQEQQSSRKERELREERNSRVEQSSREVRELQEEQNSREVRELQEEHGLPGERSLRERQETRGGRNSQEEHWEFYWAHFVPRPHWSRWLQLPESTKGLIYLHIAEEELRERISLTFLRMIHDNRGISALHEELALNALEEIILLITEKHSQEKAPQLDPRIEEVQQILARQLSEQHTVAELAKRINLSPSRLAHLFKEQVGDSIIETLLKMRLRQAARFLEFTSRQVTEIAGDVGFSSLYYFSRQFTQYYGMSPTIYRDKAQRKQ